MPYNHITSLLNESVNFLNCAPGKVIIDGTIGGFGHANLICDRLGHNGTFVGIDQDLDAIQNARFMAKKKLPKIHIRHENFVNLAQILKEINIPSADGILIDTGISLHQIKTSGRGFSFLSNEPLDMRMNIQTKTTAAMLLATLNEKEMTTIFRKYGEEHWAAKIARHLVKIRRVTPIKTSKHLSCLIEKIVPKNYTKQRKIHPATRIFMALRIAVNQELEFLEQFLKTAINLLNPAGRLCIISFHSLEDRIVKNTFKTFEQPCTCPSDFPICVCKLTPVARLITKKVVRPSPEEIKKNPMSRSARLRVIEKI